MPATFLPETYIAEAADLLAAMANSKRMLILEIISREEVSVGSLALKVDLSQSALSQHLSKLKSSKLVNTRRDAQTVYYRCNSNAVILLLATLREMYEIDDRRMLSSRTA